MKAKPAKSPAKAKPAKAKTASGLLGKLRGALSKKPAAKPVTAKPATKSASKPASSAKSVTSAKPVNSSRPLPANGHKPAASAVAKSMAAKVATPTRTVAAAPRSLVGMKMPNEDQVRRMHERDYMNDTQLEFFRQRLLQMREEVLARELDVKERLHQREVFADPADRATAEEEHWLDLRLREREAFLLRKIDDALRRIENREYGYCEKTGDPIGIPRLLARPTATVCVDVKGQDERVEAQFRDR